MGTRSSLNKAARETLTGLSGLSNSIVTEDGGNTFLQPPVCSYSNAVEVSAATLTIAYATHMGRPVIAKQACVFTLPAVADVKGDIWIINGAGDGIEISVSPNASDKFVWDIAGAAGTDNKDIINTEATAKLGDYVKLRYASADGWAIKEFGGTWADEA